MFVCKLRHLRFKSVLHLSFLSVSSVSKRKYGDREGGSGAWPWDMSIPLKLFLAIVCFPRRPH